ECERPALRPLPAARYELEEWRRARVHSADYHVEVAHHLGSAVAQGTPSARRSCEGRSGEVRSGEVIRHVLPG
ncbi:MAG: hypothetical protein LH624_14395, partial [Cryobacterium sp.]|nr:hypothetical protein [Cryobacterium sp.]